MPERTPHVKICGITSAEDGRLAVSHGAWAIGLIFAPESPRRVGVDTAAAISEELRRKVEVAGVFVNAPLDEVAAIADAARLSLLQLHGDEGPSYCSEAARRTGARVIKAVGVRSGADVQSLGAFHTDFHLVDGRTATQRGGTGQPFDWSLLARRLGEVPLILSGGLTPGNVGEGIAAVRPWGVDVSSGVEGGPGRKDPERLEAFFAAVRGAAVPVAP